MIASTHLAFVCLLTLLPAALLAKEVPPGLRPAKAVDDPEKPIVPKLEQQQDQQQLEEANIVPTQSNRLAAEEEQEEAQQEGKTEEPKVEQPAETSSEKKDNVEAKILAGDKPLIFQKNGKNKRRLTPAVPGSGTQVVQQVIKAPVSEPEEGTTAKPNVRTIPPPVGKDYGVNTLLQTNLVDSKGRVLKGVSAVPIVVPDIRNPKASRASASRVESEAEKAVRINFSG